MDQSSNDLIRKLDNKRDDYIEAFREVHLNLTNAIRAHSKATECTEAKERTSVEEGSLESSGAECVKEVENESIQPETIFDGYEERCVQEHLPHQSFDENSLREQMSLINNELHPQLPNLEAAEDWRADLRTVSSEYPLGGPCCQIYDVGLDGALSPSECSTHLRKDARQSIWDQLRQSPVERSEAAGRIVFVRDLNVVLFMILFHTMGDAFDFEALLCFSKKVSPSPPFDQGDFGCSGDGYRKFVFHLTYLGEDLTTATPAPLLHSTIAQYPRLRRRTSTVILALHNTELNAVCNAFSPWRMLCVQLDTASDYFFTACRASRRRYTCGPEAFLEVLLGEICDARHISQLLFREISDFVTPSQACSKSDTYMLDVSLCDAQSMKRSIEHDQQLTSCEVFNPHLIDPHLSAEDDLDMARRCFWASTTLDAIGKDLVCIKESYDRMFTSAIWEGRHETFWILCDPQSRRGESYHDMMTRLRAYFESEIAKVATLAWRVDERRKDIVAQESRRSTLASEIAAKQSGIAISQGRNIRLLTTVSIFFLPLTYVTSVFGMTNMDPDQGFWMFGIVTTAICVPFFILMASLNSKRGFAFWERTFKVALQKIATLWSRLFAVISGGKESQKAGVGLKSTSGKNRVPEEEHEAVLGAAREDEATSKPLRDVRGVRSRLFSPRSRLRRDGIGEQKV